MEEKLDSIQKKIEELQNASLREKMNALEPLFFEVYEACRNSEISFPLLLKLSQLENQLTDRMIDAFPKLEPSLEASDKERVLKQIVYYARKQAKQVYGCDVSCDSLRTRSLDISNLVLETSKSIQVPACLIDIGTLFHFPYSHYAVLAYVEDSFYLLDVTYQEFFMLGYNFSNRYYEHPSYIRTCELGGRMLENRERSAKKMIQDGYLPVFSEDFQNYCDACCEFGEIECKPVKEHLLDFLKPIERSSDKIDRILVSKLQYL